MNASSVSSASKSVACRETTWSTYYEMGLLHPKIGSTALHLYNNGYRDGIDAIDAHGCVDVPEGPGLGVEYDWDFIAAHRTDGAVYK